MSSDPWNDIPNLSHSRASALEESRAGDPGRFFGPVSASGVDPVTGRILNIPRVSVYRNGAGTANSSSVDLCSWDSEEYDSNGMWSILNPGRLVAHVPGPYRVTAWWTWSANAAGQRGLLIRKTESSTGIQSSYPVGVLGEGHSVTAVGAGLYTVTGPLSYDIELNASDYVECFVTQFSGINIAYIAASLTARSNGFQMHLISTIGSDNQ